MKAPFLSLYLSRFDDESGYEWAAVLDGYSSSFPTVVIIGRAFDLAGAMSNAQLEVIEEVEHQRKLLEYRKKLDALSMERSES